MPGRNPNIENIRGYQANKLHQLDLDGLPFVGAYLEDGDALFRSDTFCRYFECVHQIMFIRMCAKCRIFLDEICADVQNPWRYDFVRFLPT